MSFFFRFWGHERSVFQQSSILKHCTWSERLKKVHHVWVHLMNLYGLNWRSTWPLMNHPNNIPFRGPEAMCNQLVMLNLQKIEKKYVFEVLRLLEAKFQSFSFLYLNPILNGSSRWKNFFDPSQSGQLGYLAGWCHHFVRWCQVLSAYWPGWCHDC